MDENDTRWNEIDSLIFVRSRIASFKAYREATGASILQAKEALYTRELMLLACCPERFKQDSEYRDEARDALKAVPGPVRVIAGYWDGDSFGWFIQLCAIVERPSPYHPRFRPYGLSLVRGSANQIEYAKEFGSELAASVGASFYLTDTAFNEDKRWWDDKAAQGPA